MLYCFESDDIRKFIIHEKEYSKLESMGILYSKNDNKFVNMNGKEIVIANQKIFPRTEHKELLIKAINNFSGKSIQTLDDIKKISNWTQYYHTKRKLEVINKENYLEENYIEKLKEDYESKLYIKESTNNKIIISEKVEIKKDQYGQKIYRCFIGNNEIINISRKTFQKHMIDPIVFAKSKLIVDNMPKDFPKYYVMDVFEYLKNGITEIDVMKFSPIISAEPYLYNSVMDIRQDILHFNMDDIPEQKQLIKKYLMNNKKS